jgi:hypothetical protein
MLSKEYSNIVTNINEKIDKYYQIYSYNKFVDLVKHRKIKLDNALLIIDEVQNIVSEHGNFYKVIMGIIKNAPSSLRTVIMSATPIFDKPMELGLTLNLLRPKEPFLIGNKFDEQYIDYKVINDKPVYTLKNHKELSEKLNGLVSYYQGAPSYVFPERIRCFLKGWIRQYSGRLKE